MKTAPCYSNKDYYGYFHIDLSGKKVLDIGSSIGSFMKSKKFQLSNEELAKAKKYTSMDINPASGADIIGDAHTLPFKNQEIDIVLANNVIEHFYDPQRAVSEMYRVLKKGGELYFTIPFMYPIHEAPHDYVRFTKYGLQNLFSDFKNVEIHERGGWFSTTANFIYKLSHVLDKIRLGSLLRLILYPILTLWVQLDRFDNSGAFVRAYFGKMSK
ncbi:class I SAM-dependent methyltransferase [Leptospira sp. SA-E8]|uniref:class I SAM-dependent methyltransferase n=1 Tax=Leptospira sp. SA-E8 TaxID=3422259 RepID=UPI003EBA4091